MARIVVEVSEEINKKINEFKKKEGYMTKSEAVRAILREYFKIKGVESSAN
jgi:metal-responsive CopG/Arc/MetJ family transcriptional regulator